MFTDFKGNLLRELISRNSWEFLWNFTPKNSWKILLNAYLEIPEKFLGLGHQVYGFLGELNKSNWHLFRVYSNVILTSLKDILMSIGRHFMTYDCGIFINLFLNWGAIKKALRILYMIGPLTEVNIVLFLRNRRFNVNFFIS